MKIMQRLVLVFGVLGLLSLVAYGVNPYNKVNGSWIVISGKVTKVFPNQFTLDYGKGNVIVEMDDGDRDADAYKLLKGDEVTVSGMIDRDFLEKTSIEAGTVYVKNINTTFYSSAIDEEDVGGMHFYPLPTLTNGITQIYGTISSIKDKTFTINTGSATVKINTEDLGYNPLDDKGYLKLKNGDFVAVTGDLEPAFFTDYALVAKTITAYNSKKMEKKKDSSS